MNWKLNLILGLAGLLVGCPVSQPPESKGGLTVTVSGAPAGSSLSVTVSGPNGFSKALSATATLSDLEPGAYSVTAAPMVAANLEYKGGITGSPASVTAGTTASVTVTYAKSATLISNLSDTGAGSLREAMLNVAPGDTVKFAAGTTGTVELSSELEIIKNLRLEGNGVTLSGGNAHRVLSIASGANVTVKGLKLTGGKSVAPTSSDGVRPQGLSDGQGGVIYNAGSLTLQDAEISSGEADVGGGVFNAMGATLTLQSGSIKGNKATGNGNAQGLGGGVFNDEGAMFTVIGGNIEGNSAARLHGGVSNAGTLVMNGGAIKQNSTLNAGGGVGSYAPGTFTMNGGSIEDNEVTFVNTGQFNGVGGGVYAFGTFVMNDGAIKNNKVKNVGGGVLVESASFTMKGGLIEGNTAQGGAQGQAGGGVFNYKGTFKLEGGTIKGNTALEGGGVTVSNTTQTFISGGSIQGNAGTLRGGGLRIYSTASATMTGGKIDANTSENGAGVFIGGPNGNVGNNGGIFNFQNGEITTNVSVKGGGGIGNDGVLTVSGGLIQENSSGNYGGGIRVFSAGKLNMTGGTVKNNSAVEAGGGIKLDGGSSSLSGGLVTGNTAKYGGGLEFYQTVFTMTGGTVSNNNGTENAGGINVGEGSTFTLENGMIENNMAAKFGGGVNQYKSIFVMKGGAIRGNTVTTESGGGVNLFDMSALTMSGGVIESNKAMAVGRNGGGIHAVGPLPIITIEDGTIRNNQAENLGGGVATYQAKIVMEGGAISGNTAKNGGGISVDGISSSKGSFALSGGTITSNTVTISGGGIFSTANGVLTRTGGTVSANTPTDITP